MCKLSTHRLLHDFMQIQVSVQKQFILAYSKRKQLPFFFNVCKVIKEMSFDCHYKKKKEYFLGAEIYIYQQSVICCKGFLISRSSIPSWCIGLKKSIQYHVSMLYLNLVISLSWKRNRLFCKGFLICRSCTLSLHIASVWRSP